MEGSTSTSTRGEQTPRERENAFRIWVDWALLPGLSSPHFPRRSAPIAYFPLSMTLFDHVRNDVSSLGTIGG